VGDVRCEPELFNTAPTETSDLPSSPEELDQLVQVCFIRVVVAELYRTVVEDLCFFNDNVTLVGLVLMQVNKLCLKQEVTQAVLHVFRGIS